MLGKEFRGLAEAVTRTYGSDPWFFLRELAQNSRDAGAKNIWVAAARTSDGHETLTFTDDGLGMSLEHARRFLFRLYASDKIGDKTSAGQYGIGFWTVLDFKPAQILLQSRHRKESWAMTLDAELEARPSPCTLIQSGTSIGLDRPAAFATEADFKQSLELALRNYCRFLRRNDRRGSMLPVFFLGQNLTVPIRLPGPLSYSFHNGAVEGAVGLGEKPLVRLYARGLPVWEGALLGQMSHLQTRAAVPGEIGQGLFPIFLLNGNRLDVTFSRNLALENKALEHVRKTAAKALRKLLANALENAFPRPWYLRSGDHFRTFAGRFRRPGWLWLALALLVILPLEIVLLERFFPGHSRSAPKFFDLSTSSIQYSGATVAGDSSELSANFSYFPPDPTWFKVFSAADYDLITGFIRRQTEVFSPPGHDHSCQPGQAVTMSLSTAAAGRVLLPLPPGHVIDPASVLLGQGPQRLSLSGNRLGEWSAEIPSARETITYRSCPQPGQTELTAAERDRLISLPADLAFPAALQRSLAENGSLAVAEKAARARSLVRAAINYDASEATARLYRQASRGRQWLTRVLEIGQGDCDVINGVHVLMLRKMGIPARLAVGLIGQDGRIRSGLHAWSEYFDRGWRIVDASADGARATAPTASPSIRTARPGRNTPDETSPFTEAGPMKSITLFAVMSAAAALLLIIIYLLRRNGGRRRTSTASAEGGRDLVLPVIRQALLQPEIWGRQSPLWNHRFLPTVRSGPMAIGRAFALLGRGRLMFFTRPNPLVIAMQNWRIPILDLRQDYFAPLLNLISGAVSLDLLFRLRPQAMPERRSDAEELLAAVNFLLAKKMKTPLPCLLTPGLVEADFYHVSLPVTPRRRHIFFPRRFIAVNPAGRRLAELSALFKQNRALAVFRFLRVLHSESLLPFADPEAFLGKAARRLLRQCP